MNKRERDTKLPDSRVVIRDFPGYMPNADPHDIPPGASVDSVNATSARAGELRVRLGAKVVRFE